MSPVKPTKHKWVHAALSQEDTVLCREKLTNLTNDLTIAKLAYLAQAKDISKKNTIDSQYCSSRTTSWTTRALHLGGKQLQAKQATNIWNAFVSCELQAVNDDLGPGSHFKLPVL
ncbi:hypothetical protein K439DRAFT_1615880 [Ramaria rubella]|nr:hypothetical protein K439DRAFT_1615880 [Ramaria rubella]